MDRTLEIGVREGGEIEKIEISGPEKGIFCEEAEESTLFPELVHGKYVELKGDEITRINESTNTIGFKYKDHILTCAPKDGNIANFKRKMLSQEEGHVLAQGVEISGFVDRLDKHGEIKEKKPRLLFLDIRLLPSQNKQIPLFS